MTDKTTSPVLSVCAIEVGHPPDTPSVWFDRNQPSLSVCDRHRRQYDERDDLGPYDWRPVATGSVQP